MFEQDVTFANAHEKMTALGQAFGIDTRTVDEIQRQELQEARAAAYLAAGRPFNPVNIG
ncbi:MAG: hypothetical protein NDI90_04325 [Nitrospira sp. BO4]|jgi:hypothetical protein|nr:hypothetical protein [Nitrospira sp. BO4]